MEKYSDQKEISEKLRLINITVEAACSAEREAIYIFSLGVQK